MQSSPGNIQSLTHFVLVHQPSNHLFFFLFPAVYYQPQQPQPQQPQQQQPPQQQQQQPQQTQQPQQPQQVPVAPSPITTVTQPRENSGASRRARSSALRIVDPNTNRDILTGEEVPPSAVVTPTTATPPEIVAAGVVPAPVVAADEVEAPFFSETEDIVSTPSNNTSVPLIKKVKAKEKTVPTVVASPTPSVPAAVTAPVGATPIIAVPVTQENGEFPSSNDPPNNIIMTAFLPMNLPANLKSIQPYLEMATDYASVDPCISYWCNDLI